jgi:hypothetical protein
MGLEGVKKIRKGKDKNYTAMENPDVVPYTDETSEERDGEDVPECDRTKFIYCIVPERCEFVKIGRWAGSIINLKHRYITYCGKFTLCLFEVSDPVAAERECKQRLRQYHYTNELYEKAAEDEFLHIGKELAQTSISGGDYIRRYICDRSAQHQRMMQRKLFKRQCKAAGMFHGATALGSVGDERDALVINENIGDEGVDLVISCLASDAEDIACDGFVVKTKAIHEVITALGLRHILDHKTEFSVDDRKSQLMQTALFRQGTQVYRIFNRGWKNR